MCSRSTTVALDDAKLGKHACGSRRLPAATIVLGIRPEDLDDAALSDGDRPALAGRVTLREALGSEVLVHFTIDARQAMTDEMRELAEDVGDDRGASQFAARTPTTVCRARRTFQPSYERGRRRHRRGFAGSTCALHFFDPSTGAAIYDAAGIHRSLCGPPMKHRQPFTLGCAAEEPALERPLRGDEHDRDGGRRDHVASATADRVDPKMSESPTWIGSCLSSDSKT